MRHQSLHPAIVQLMTTKPPFLPGLTIDVTIVPTLDREDLFDPGWTRAQEYLAMREWTSLNLAEDEAPEPDLAARVLEDAINAFQPQTSFRLERVGLRPEFVVLGASRPLVFVTTTLEPIPWLDPTTSGGAFPTSAGEHWAQERLLVRATRRWGTDAKHDKEAALTLLDEIGRALPATHWRLA